MRIFILFVIVVEVYCQFLLSKSTLFYYSCHVFVTVDCGITVVLGAGAEAAKCAVKKLLTHSLMSLPNFLRVGGGGCMGLEVRCCAME